MGGSAAAGVSFPEESRRELDGRAVGVTSMLVFHLILIFGLQSSAIKAAPDISTSKA